MRVICINDNWIRAVGSEHKAGPRFLDEDIVIDEHYSFKYGAFYYSLQRFGSETFFSVDHFATLPEQTADEMKEETKEAIANLETV